MGPFETGSRAALIFVFGLALLGKAKDRAAFDAFAQTLPSFGLPAGLPSRPAAAAVLLLEGAAVLLLVLAPLAGALASLASLALFTGGLAWAVRRGRPVSCRCFGASVSPVGPSQLWRNGSLLALTLVLLGHLLAPGAPAPLPQRLLALAVGGTAGLLVSRWDDLAYLVHGA